MLTIAWFELRTKLKLVSTYVYVLVFAALAALWMAAAGGAFASANVVFSTDKVYINAPFALAQTVAILGLLGVVVIAAMMGRAIQQDFEHHTFHFYFTAPIRKRDYVLGRYLGTLAVLLFVFLGIGLGVVIGTHWPGVDASRIGPWSIAAFVQPYLILLLPNVLFLGACFFGIAALTRRMLPAYIAGVVVLIGYVIALRLLRDIDNRSLAALIDPMGSVAVSLVTRYWTPAEKNALLVPLRDELLWNRALWVAVGAAVFAACYARFRLVYAPSERTRIHKRKATEEAAAPTPPRVVPALPRIALRTDVPAYLRMLPALVALYLRETVKNVYFAVIVLCGALFVLGNAKVVGSIYGTNTYPVTYQVIDFASGTFALFVLIITAIYAGELVWRERDAGIALITDSMPTPGWLAFIAKLATLMATQALLQVVVMICGIVVQLFNGYTHLELGQYAYRLFALQLPDYWMIAALALTIHTLVNHKYLGHLLVVVFYVAQVTAGAFGFDHHLYSFASTPNVVYSDMNGYGDFVAPVRWFQLYWGAASVLLLVIARLFWMRGSDTQWALRWRIARKRFTAPLATVAVIAAVVFVATGAWIYYNTNVLNPYRTEFAQDELRAEYERRYKSLLAKPQPKVVGVRIAVDIFPEERRVGFKGTYTLRNKTEAPIPELYLRVNESAAVHRLVASIPLMLAEERRDLEWMRYSLQRPLQPGEAMTLDFDLSYPPPGFTNKGPHMVAIENGTFVNSALLPAIGYQEQLELSEDAQRRKHKLGPRERMHDLDDAAARQRNYISSDGDWIDFDAVIGTAPDQIALAPGYLQREWIENGRRHFHYRMDVPILDFYAFLSARYAVRRDVWRTPEGNDLPIEIYYQPGHEYNLDAMLAGVRESLDYYTKNFSPYQHRQVRIVEFPRYASFAQSFPNTIPYSESIGFIAKVDPKDPKDIDYPYYVTAHEVAHQWWAHQVIGANVQGATMLSETLAQYSALMVMKHKYGDAKMKRFLDYELDSYLVGRGSERKKEQPLYRNENQPYIHYRKGSLAMYALQDAIGEAAVNRALASYIAKVAYQEPPYTTSRELLAELRAVTPPELQYFVTDLFETITLWENRALSASAVDAGGGKYEVTLKVSAAKMRADEEGRQTEVPMNDLVDIGVLGEGDRPLYLAKHRIASGETTLTFDVEGKPVKAGIDPVLKLIDRRPTDNTVPVTLSKE